MSLELSGFQKNVCCELRSQFLAMVQLWSLFLVSTQVLLSPFGSLLGHSLSLCLAFDFCLTSVYSVQFISACDCPQDAGRVLQCHGTL